MLLGGETRPTGKFRTLLRAFAAHLKVHVEESNRDYFMYSDSWHQEIYPRYTITNR